MKEVKLVFTAYLRVADEDSIESAMELARANYGNEVADYGVFTIEGESNE
jgi:hypothetical protein